MTTRREILAAAVLLGPLSLALKTAQAAQGQGGPKMADFLFVQNARGISHAGWHPYLSTSSGCR